MHRPSLLRLSLKKTSAVLGAVLFVDRKHRMTCQCLVDAVAGDPRIDCHRDTDLDVRVTSQSNFPMPTSASGRAVKSLERPWSEGMHGPCVACIHDGRACPLSDRTAKVFFLGERLVPTHLQTKRRKPPQSDM